MKKIFLTLLVCISTLALSAQGLTSKNGTPILPQKGDWSLGFDATPALNYFGNLLGSSGENTVNMNYFEENTIVGQLMTSDNTSYRLKAGINYSSTKVDSIESNSIGVNLGAGKATYRGKGRLQGYYGYEASIGFGSADDNGTKTSSFGIGARGFIGAQYFFAPKMSLGAEYGWGPSYTSVKDGASSINVGTDNLGGGIFLSLYF